MGVRLSKRALAAQFVDQLQHQDLQTLAAATMQLAADQGYSDQLPSLVAAIEQELLSRHQVAEIQITTAHDLDRTELNQIVEALAQQANLESYSYTHRVQPELIGGFEAKIGDQVIRDTIQHKLTQLGVVHG